jgi:hypothetical protein
MTTAQRSGGRRGLWPGPLRLHSAQLPVWRDDTLPSLSALRPTGLNERGFRDLDRRYSRSPGLSRRAAARARSWAAPAA